MKTDLKIKLNIIVYSSVFIVLFSLTGCKREMENKLKGAWIIEEYSYHGYDNIVIEFYSNGIVFKESGKVRIPSRKVGDKRSGNWKIENVGGKYHLIIENGNESFDGTYQLIFFTKDNRYYVMLYSDNRKIVLESFFR